jgi:hypothetical protein
VEDPARGWRLEPGGEAAAESNSEAAVEMNRRIAPKITDGEEGERQRARLTRRGPMGRGRRVLGRTKRASVANRVVPVPTQRARCSARHGTSHRTVPTWAQLQPCCAVLRHYGPCRTTGWPD